MREVLWVAAGGAVGAVARYGVGIAAARLLGTGFPWGTLAVNVAGCLAMGMALETLAAGEARASAAGMATAGLSSSVWRHAIAIGFLGALTTFSSFSADTLQAVRAGQPLIAGANVLANVTLSLSAVWAGAALLRGLA